MRTFWCSKIILWCSIFLVQHGVYFSAFMFTQISAVINIKQILSSLRCTYLLLNIQYSKELHQKDLNIVLNEPQVSSENTCYTFNNPL